MRNRRLAVPGALSVVVLSLGALTLGRKKEPPAAPPLPAVTVAPVEQREISDWDEFTGRLQAVDAVEIRPRVSGYIKRVAFDEGKEVKKGEVLFEIDPRPYQADLSHAVAELEGARSAAALAKSDVERASKLVNVQAISREEYDSRTSAETQGGASVRAAEAAAQTARLNLEWTQVRSPISGRVSNALVTPGNLVQAGPPEATLLTTVVSLDPMYLYFDSDEQTYLRYAGLARSAGTNWRNARLAVYLGLANEDGFPHEGRLDFVDNQVDPNTGTIRTRAVFSNKSRALTPGLFARVKLVGSQKTQALLVRDAAIGTDQDRKFVLVLEKGDTLAYRPIVPGRLTDDGLRIVTSGLTPEDRIVVNGLMRVRPGVKVAPTVGKMELDSSTAAGSTKQ
jgi:membrane fusion protein, multidrug efflux system